jgi:bifunctional non-homologous end joining protein LigD
MIQPVRPMLASSATEPFDSGDYFFEIKWDGVRALAAVEGGRWRMWGRELADYTERYPELDALRRLPSGTVVDGELVVFQEGCPDLSAILRRHQLVHPTRIHHAGRHWPVRFVLFDLLYHRGRSLLQEPYVQRRTLLAELLADGDAPGLAFSDGIAEFGRDFFRRAVTKGHEGIMAKRKSSPYRPGQRSAAWQKIKPARVLPCVIIGYTAWQGELHSLLVAGLWEGSLRYVGQVTSGFTRQAKRELARRLAQLGRQLRPIVTCSKRAWWVDAELYCRVRFLRWTVNGRLRSASFAGWLGESSRPRTS